MERSPLTLFSKGSPLFFKGALLALLLLTVVFADVRPDTVTALVFVTVVLTVDHPVEFTVRVFHVVVLADVRPAAGLAISSSTVVLGDDRPTTVTTPVPVSVVWAHSTQTLLS